MLNPQFFQEKKVKKGIDILERFFIDLSSPRIAKRLGTVAKDLVDHIVCIWVYVCKFQYLNT